MREWSKKTELFWMSLASIDIRNQMVEESRMSNIQRKRRRILSYLREIQFVFRSSKDWETRLNLLKNTALYHANNMAGGRMVGGSSLQAKLRLTNDFDVKIRLRPFAGDLFVLYEVLMDRCYYIPDDILQPDKVSTILDCGANIGITALYLASRYPKARVFCIEPNDDNFNALRHNTVAEPRIIPIHGAIVGRACKSVRLSMTRPAWGNFITEDDCGHEVPAITIGQILKDYGIPRVDLLKVDIEGSEKEVFAAGQFMQWVDFVVIELHGSYDLSRFSVDIAQWGFEAISPASRSDLRMVIARPSKDRIGDRVKQKRNSL
jgi:FkbM family methyltransferase